MAFSCSQTILSAPSVLRYVRGSGHYKVGLQVITWFEHE